MRFKRILTATFVVSPWCVSWVSVPDQVGTGWNRSEGSTAPRLEGPERARLSRTFCQRSPACRNRVRLAWTGDLRDQLLRSHQAVAVGEELGDLAPVLVAVEHESAQVAAPVGCEVRQPQPPEEIGVLGRHP